MIRGTVLFFNKKKGFGFIRNNETELDIFVHVKGLIDFIKEGDDVTYEEAQGAKSPNAINVTVVRKPGDETHTRKMKRPRIRKP